MQAWDDGRPFRELIEADARVALSDDELDRAFDLRRSLANIGAVFEALDAL